MTTQEINFRVKARKHAKTTPVQFRIEHNLTDFGYTLDKLFDEWEEQAEDLTSQPEFINYIKQKVNHKNLICHATI